MSIDIRQPKIDSATEAGQLRQIKSYLYQLVEQLNFALSSTDTSVSSEGAKTATTTTAASNQPVAQKSTQSIFNSLKVFIINSSDILNAYYEEISQRLDDVYVSDTDFEAYGKKISQDIKAISDEVGGVSSDLETYAESTDTIIQNISDTVEEISNDIQVIMEALNELTAYVKTGMLYNDDEGRPVYGVDLSKRDTDDGVEDIDTKLGRNVLIGDVPLKDYILSVINEGG